AGRGPLLESAPRRARDGALVEYSQSGYRPTWVGVLNWGVSAGRSQDRVAAALALEDAVIGIVVEDIAAEDDVTALTAPYDLLTRGAIGGPPSESLAFALKSRPGRLAAMAYLVLAVAGTAMTMSNAIGPAACVAGIAVVAGVMSAFRVRAARASERHRVRP
ncbi:MAG: hypothetical protein ACJ77B_05345, partial [Chloroflexota bacterium]